MNSVQSVLEARLDSEHEQAIIRLVVASLVFLAIMGAQASGWVSEVAISISAVYGGFLLAAVALLGWIVISPRIFATRRFTGMVLDMIGLGFSVYYLGAAGAVLFPVYVWVIVGNGLRYGQLYLYTAMGLALISLLPGMVNAGYWLSNPFVALALITGVVILPLYFSALLQRLNQSNNALRAVIMELAQMAHQDPLTGLPNRNLFNDMLNNTLAAARRYGRSFAVVFLDLDEFKNINDTLGHAAGDELIRAVGQRLKGSIRESDIVARLGGDEFVVLLNEVAPRDVDRIARKLLDALATPLQLGQEARRMSASIGVALYPGAGEDVDTILNHADSAMYRAKRAGKNRYYLYAPDVCRYVPSLQSIAT